MKHEDAIQAAAITSFLQQHSHHITHAVVAHTPHRTFGLNAAQVQARVAQARQDCRHFRNCLNKELYGNRARRKPDVYQPLLLPTLEGGLVTHDLQLTLHYNFSLGNLPCDLSFDSFKSIFFDCWVNRAQQSPDIHYTLIRSPIDARGWLDYTLKEARDHGNTEVWDVQNTQIPYGALKAD